MTFDKARAVIHLLTSRGRDFQRIAMLIYLIDWHVAQATGRQATDYEYEINIRGPRLMHLEQLVRANAQQPLRILQAIGFGRLNRSIMLDHATTTAVEQVLAQTAGLTKADLLKQIRSTTPVRQGRPNGQAERADLGAIANAERARLAA